VAFSPDGTKLATASADETTRVWDVDTGKSLGDVIKHKGPVVAVAFSPDGATLATASHDKTARLWDVPSGELLGDALKHGGKGDTVAFSPDSTKLTTTSAWDRTARLWDVATGQPLGDAFQHWGGLVALSPDGTKLATRAGRAGLWDVTTGPLFDATSPDGTKRATLSQGGSARVWDVATGQSWALPHQYWSLLAFSPVGTKLATLSEDGTVRVWDADKPMEDALQYKDQVLRAVAFSPDGTRLATGSDDKTARLWDVVTGKPLGDALKHSGSVEAVAFSPDGTKLATKSGKTVRLWDVATYKPLGDALQHTTPVKDMAFSPNGAKLATAGRADWLGDSTHIWDISGELVEPAAQVYVWIETLIGATVSDDGVIRQLNSDEMRRKQDEVRTAGGPPRSWRAALDRRHEVMHRNDWHLLRDLGVRHARAGRWSEATAAFESAIKAQPEEHLLWYQGAPLWLMLADTAAYHRHREAMLVRFGKTDNVMVAGRTAMACLLFPYMLTPHSDQVRLANQAITGTVEHAYYRRFLYTRGLAHYRAGEFGQAVERLEKCVTSERPEIGCDGPAYLVLAMAHHRLGHADEASQALAKAHKTIDVKTWPAINSADLGDSWHDVVIIDILRREAEALLGGRGATPVKK
jgi:WD40 repeat protein/Flp pilus assembly protein TadD